MVVSTSAPMAQKRSSFRTGLLQFAKSIAHWKNSIHKAEDDPGATKVNITEQLLPPEMDLGAGDSRARQEIIKVTKWVHVKYLH